MNDFKVGDKVEVVDTSGCSGYYGKLGEVGVVTKIDVSCHGADYDLVGTSLVEGRYMHRRRFKKVEATNETLRKELSDAIDVLAKYEILVSARSRNLSGSLQFGYSLEDMAFWHNKDNLIDYLLPTKTPKQIEVERIEEEIRKLADDLSKLK